MTSHTKFEVNLISYSSVMETARPIRRQEMVRIQQKVTTYPHPKYANVFTPQVLGQSSQMICYL